MLCAMEHQRAACRFSHRQQLHEAVTKPACLAAVIVNLVRVVSLGLQRTKSPCLHCAGGVQVDLFKYGNLRVGKIDNSNATPPGRRVV
jgi:hypothetical protein